MDDRLITIFAEMAGKDMADACVPSLSMRILRILVSHDENRPIGQTRKIASFLNSYPLPDIDSHEGFKFNLQILRMRKRAEMLSSSDVQGALEFVLQECDERLTSSQREDLVHVISLLPDLNSFIRVYEEIDVTYHPAALELIAISIRNMKLSIEGLGWCIQKFAHIVSSCKESGDLEVILVEGRGVLSAVLEFVIPMYSITFKSKAQMILSQIKTLQSATRTIQMICGNIKETLAKDKLHSKQNSAKLFKAVASSKHYLESLVASIKQLLEENDCGCAFWLGNLKNKGLEGEEIAASQIPLSHST